MNLCSTALLVIISLQFTFTTGVPPEPVGLLVDPGRMCRRGRRSRDSTNFILPGKVGVATANRQRRKVYTVCTKEPGVIHEATKGAKMATLECQHQFKARHWNCSALPRSIRKILNRDTRETAFVNAITSAGVTLSLTEGCSTGRLHDCPCDRTVSGMTTASGDWEWGGCGDNVHVGYKKSKDILDSRSRRRNDLRSVITLHNNEAGRLAVRDHMRLVCKCHGLSGSCTLKTCWHKVPAIRDVGERLKRQFDGAIKVIPGNDGKSVLPAISTVKPPGKEDLLYFEDSVDFCTGSRKTGSLGTTGRECDADSLGVDGCDLLCCGRGYNTRVIRIKQNCKCRFKWCCEVTCETCVIRKVIHTCR